MNPIEKRELKSFYTLTSEAFVLVKKNIHSLALISVIPLVFVGASQSVLGSLEILSNPVALWIFGIFGVFFIIAGFAFRVIYPMSIIRGIDNINSLTPADPSVLYKRSFADFWSYLLIVILLCLSVTAGSVFLVIPGLIAFLYFGFGAFTYIFEGKRGISALIASAWLVRGRLYDVFQRMFPAALLAFIASLAILMVVGSVSNLTGMSADVAQFLSSLFITMFVMPFLYTFGYFLYRDLALSVGREIDPAFQRTAKIWIIVLTIFGGIAILSIPVVATVLVMVGKLTIS